MSRDGDALRLTVLEAREAIRELAMVYCHLLDARSLDAVAELFVPDGTLVTPGTCSTGCAEIRGFYEERMSKFELTFHYPHTHVIKDLDEQTAAGVVTAHAEHGIGGACLLAALRYDDLYEKKAGSWRFRRREITISYFLPWDELATGYGGGATAARPT